VIGGIDGGWITVTVLVLVLGTTLELVTAGADDVVSVTVLGGTVVAAVVVTVDVDVSVDTDVLVVLAGLSTPHATRCSEAASSAPMPLPWWSMIAEPSGPLS
jgi:hypothetical protein